MMMCQKDNKGGSYPRSDQKCFTEELGYGRDRKQVNISITKIGKSTGNTFPRTRVFGLI